LKAALVYATFAPFHVARLERTARIGRNNGDTVMGVEIASVQSDYSWQRSELRDLAVTLFPGTEYWTLPRRSIRKSINVLLDEIAPDVVVLPGWAFSESIGGLAWCLKRRRAAVVLSDSQPIDHPPNMAKSCLRRMLVREFDAAFVGGSPHVRYLVELGMPRESCFVGCDVVDNDRFGRDTRESGTQPDRDRPAVLFSALRLLPRKNVEGALEEFARATGSWQWIIAGDGPSKEQITRSVLDLGLSERVRMVGNVSYDDLPAWYRKADVYLQPSKSEPWGLAVNEAMAAGLPVIVSTQCGCHEDLVEDGRNGFAFDASTPGALEAALNKAWESRHKWAAMGAESKRIIAAWDLDRFGNGFWAACRAAQSRSKFRTRLITPLVARMLSTAV